jgi:hypothetical protein
MTPRRGTALAAIGLLLATGLVPACTDDDGGSEPVDPSNSSVSTDSTTPAAGQQGDDPRESRDNVDEDRDDSGAGAPSDPNSDEGSNSGATEDD